MTSRLSRAVVTLTVHPSFDPSGRHRVPGVVLGPLAVTPNVGAAGGWHITHVASGLAVNGFDEGVFHARAHAVAAMRDLLAVFPTWNPKHWSRRAKKRRQALSSAILRRHGGTSCIPERWYP